jgi:hypothetical protein
MSYDLRSQADEYRAKSALIAVIRATKPFSIVHRTREAMKIAIVIAPCYIDYNN